MIFALTLSTKTMRHFLRRQTNNIMLLALIFLLSGCGSDDKPSVPDPIEPAPVIASLQRIEISKTSVLLTQQGQSVQVTALAYDTDGELMPNLPLSWSSSRPSAASVDNTGLILAEAAVGSAQITVEAQGIRGSDITVLVAQPVENARIIDDSQVRATPMPVDTTARYETGFQYQLQLSGIDAPLVGEVFIGSGDIPIAGRVVSFTASSGAGQAVSSSASKSAYTIILELLSLNELFTQLEYSEIFEFDNEDLVINEALTSIYDVTVERDGSLSFTAFPVQESQSKTGLFQQEYSAANLPEGTAVLNGLECKYPEVGNLFPLKLETTPVFNIDANLSVEIDYSSFSGLQKLLLNGTPTLTAQLNALCIFSSA